MKLSFLLLIPSDKWQMGKSMSNYASSSVFIYFSISPLLAIHITYIGYNWKRSSVNRINYSECRHHHLIYIFQRGCPHIQCAYVGIKPRINEQQKRNVTRSVCMKRQWKSSNNRRQRGLTAAEWNIAYGSFLSSLSLSFFSECCT